MVANLVVQAVYDKLKKEIMIVRLKIVVEKDNNRGQTNQLDHNKELGVT